MSVDHLFNIYLLVSFLFMLAIGPYYLFRQRKMRGQVLYHLPRSRLHKVSVRVTIVFFISILILALIMSMIENRRPSSSQLLLMMPLLFPLFFLSSVDRFAITEAGLHYQGRFIEWKDLHAFQWKEEGDYKLGLGAEAYILGLNVLGDSFLQWLEGYKFQPDQREDIDKLLSRYLPKAT